MVKTCHAVFMCMANNSLKSISLWFIISGIPIYPGLHEKFSLVQEESQAGLHTLVHGRVHTVSRTCPPLIVKNSRQYRRNKTPSFCSLKRYKQLIQGLPKVICSLWQSLAEDLPLTSMTSVCGTRGGGRGWFPGGSPEPSTRTAGEAPWLLPHSH